MGQNTFKEQMSRRKLLQQCGSVIAGVSIVSLTGFFIHKRLTVPTATMQTGSADLQTEYIPSPYRLVFSFKVPGNIEAFEMVDNRLIVAAAERIYIYGQTGSLSNSFAIDGHVRDIAVEGDLVYLLFPTRIKVYRINGVPVNEWEACSELSDYCSFAVAAGSIFVSDAANKNLCKYTAEGDFVKFIDSPNGFVIPSYTFGVTCVDGVVHCSNSGRHQIEKYSLDGEYIGAYGKAGGVAGTFCGCCNPVHLAHTSTGDIITSEKGNPRISCYGADGEFRSLLLDSKSLGGGSTAYDIKVSNDKLFATGKDMISIFQYDRVLAAQTACTTCSVSYCPLREGVNI